VGGGGGGGGDVDIRELKPGQIRPFYKFEQNQLNRYVRTQPLARTAQAGALGAYGGLGGLLAPLASAENYYGNIIQQQGALPQSQVRDVAQRTLGSLPAGSLQNPSAIAAQVLNQQSAQEARLAGATQEAGTLSQQRQALQSGALNQLTGVQESNVRGFANLFSPILQVPLANLQARIAEAQAQAQLQQQQSAGKSSALGGGISALGTIGGAVAMGL
jgi:hypothetical protein